MADKLPKNPKRQVLDATLVALGVTHGATEVAMAAMELAGMVTTGPSEAEVAAMPAPQPRPPAEQPATTVADTA